MAKPARIQTFEDVETAQQFNDYRLDRISRAMDRLIETVGKTSLRVDATAEAVRKFTEASAKSIDELKAAMAETTAKSAEAVQKSTESSMSMDEFKAVIAESTAKSAEAVRKSTESAAKSIDELKAAMAESAAKSAEAVRKSTESSMSMDEFKAVIAESTAKSAEAVRKSTESAAKSIDELKAAMAESAAKSTEAVQKSTESSMSMDEFKATMAEHRKSEEERSKDRDRQSKEMKKRSKEMDRRIANLGKQIGYIHNSHGEFVEFVASGSIKKIVKNKFKAKYCGEYRFTDSINKINLQIDAWAVRGDPDNPEVFVFEIKKKFNRKAVKQLREQIIKFRQCAPEYSICPIYPFIASATIREQDAKWVWDQGIYLLKFSDKIFQYGDTPKGFMHNYEIGLPKSKVITRVELPPFLKEQKRPDTEE